MMLELKKEKEALAKQRQKQAQLNLSVKRTDVGKYVFGTKNILAKIVNGRLLVRVGGGYLGVEEFIEQHGPMEVAK